ncbi:hypothetical protein B0A48_01147 [Cryoendolithus antarcticus]|uniref:Uncharacterized protein n=1 Tax=Cryoendolithus antarcticus TaxID=1507870 RepID=A0A1V8TSL0_9PEZI|nr:hypothetical protein B0A48_01147 [Cryoendolithus antarcticus]
MWSIHQRPGQYYDPVRDSMRNVQHRMYPNEHMGHFNSPHGYALWGNYDDMYSRNAGILNTGLAGGRNASGSRCKTSQKGLYCLGEGYAEFHVGWELTKVRMRKTWSWPGQESLIFGTKEF